VWRSPVVSGSPRTPQRDNKNGKESISTERQRGKSGCKAVTSEKLPCQFLRANGPDTALSSPTSELTRGPALLEGFLGLLALD